MGAVLLLCACNKQEQTANPYRKVVGYKPSTFEMTVPGTLTPIDAQWISMVQNGSKVTFTTKLNTTGLIRRAEYPIAGGGVCVISQKSQDLDAAFELKLASFGDDYATMNVNIKSDNLDDYSSWGVYYGKEKDVAKAATKKAAGMFVSGDNKMTITNLEPNTQYYIWAWVESTEGMQVVSSPFGFLKPTVVLAGGDLQAAIDNAPKDSEVRVIGGAVFQGGICLKADVTVSGGWNETFTEQSTSKKTIIDGGGVINCVFVGFNPTTKVKEPLESPATISNFELRNGYADDKVNKGGAIYVCGDVIVDNCYIHDNVATSRGGALLTAEDVSGTCVIKNCVIKDNISTGGHGGAVCFDGGDKAKQVVYLINNLIEGNFAKKYDGYAVVMIYNPVEMYMINNTITANKNFDENNGNPWFCIQTRKDIKMFMVNNIVAGNFSAVKGDDDNFYRQAYQAKLDCVVLDNCVVRNNIIEGGIYGDGQPEPDAEKGNVIPKVGFDLSTIFADPAKGDYMPKGDALNGDYSDDVAKIMKNYGKDLLGNSRVVGGKIAMGCYQPQ